jgi:GH24 family phage-related lysozyme (muramidase)
VSDKDADAPDAAPDAAPAPSDAGAPDAAANTPPPPGCIKGKAATLSVPGIQFIKDWELWRDTPYDDLPKDLNRTSCTVGWGHKMHRGLCTAEEKAKKMTQEEGDKILEQDYQWALDTVHDKFPEICVPQNQIDAIVSLIFNSGRANIIGKSPTNPMHRFSRILRGTEPAKEKARLVAIEIRASRGDKTRRNKEANMFENRDYDSKH